MVVIGVAAIVAVPFCVRFTRHRHDRHMMSSCANHAIQLKFLVMALMAEKEHFPSKGDARIAFAKMGHAEERSVGWLSTVSSACPESFLRDKSIGYVFVADGLSTKTAVEHSALVFSARQPSAIRATLPRHAGNGIDLSPIERRDDRPASARDRPGERRERSVFYERTCTNAARTGGKTKA